MIKNINKRFTSIDDYNCYMSNQNSFKDYEDVRLKLNFVALDHFRIVTIYLSGSITDSKKEIKID